MTAPPADPDPGFADLLDELLDAQLDGEQPDLAAVAARHPQVAHRLQEALRLARSVAGRHEQRQPSLRGYQILGELGRGGMGTVYRARHQQLDRDVALKVLPHTFGLSASSRQRFLAEARALAKVKHEHIVDIHRVVDDGDLLAFEMEFVDGPSLQTLLGHLRSVRERTGTAPTLEHAAEALGLPAEVLGATNLTTFFVQIGMKIARALGVMHAAGFVHRDVKPANVLLRRNGQPVLADFGLVRDTSLERTHLSGFAGTPVYSAPEQLRGDDSIGPPADVYAVAVTLYECLTLVPPFPGRSTTDLLRNIEGGRVPPLRRQAPHAPRDLETIVGHAMELEPQQRYEHGDALADDLRRLLDLQPIRARPPGLLRRTGKALRRNRRSLLSGLAGAMVVAAAMLPLFSGVDAAERTQAVVREQLRLARHALLEPTSRQAAIYSAWGNAATGTTGHAPAMAMLQRAIDAYGEALAAAPDHEVARREQAVVRALVWLRQLSLQHAGSLSEALSAPDYRQLALALPPGTRRLTEAVAADKVHELDTDELLAGCSADDRSGIGLLSFLTGNLQLCEAAWTSVGEAAGDQQLRDACLGLVYLRHGAPERAYLRLQAAQRDLPEATFALALADAALAMGETALARQWLASTLPGESADVERRRVEADLELATGDEASALATYRELAQQQPLEPMLQQRLAQLSIRSGDLAAAAERLDVLLLQWPGISRLRLDRARVALLQRDVPGYLRQVLAVLAATSGRRALRADAELLEVLRVGGLTRLHRDALARGTGERSGTAFLGGELPLRSLLPGRAVAALEAVLPALAEIEQRVAELQSRGPVFGGPAELALAALPLAVARLPAPHPCPAPVWRLAGELLPWAARAVLPGRWQQLRMLVVELLPTGWAITPLVRVAAPTDLSAVHMLGTSLVRGADWNHDGVAEVLVGCSSKQPAATPGRVLVVDGRNASTIASVTGDPGGNLLGHALALVGDVDGDGVEDWLAGAPAGTKQTLHGLAELRSGQDQHLIERLVGDAVSFGVDVAGIGDVDADGVPDFAVGMPPLVSNAASQGRAFVYSGRTRAVLHEFANDLPGAWFGASIAAVGDADGDRVPDLAVGGNYGRAPGLVRLFSGRNGEVLQSWQDLAPARGFGYLVAGVGDLDGDGLGDVAVSAMQPLAEGEPGQVHLFSGRSGALLVTFIDTDKGTSFGAAVARFDQGPARKPLLAIGAPLGGPGACGKIEFWTADSVKFSTVQGPGPYSLFSSRIATVGDLDGDGRPELFVTGPRSNHEGTLCRIDSTTIRFPGRAPAGRPAANR